MASSSGKTRGKTAEKPRVKRPKAGEAARRNGHVSAVPLAARADRHVLYERAVQSVDAEIDFVIETYKALRGRHPVVLREDFCGTANSACEFVRRRPANRAIGVDLDQPTLDWGRRRNIARLKPDAQKRVTLLREDVRTVRPEPADCVLAMNFSYFCFHDRATMRGYFENVHAGLAPGGLFILDAYGGSDAFKEMREKRPIKEGNFTYVWDQHSYDPITGAAVCKIHFHFPDGSKIRDAFVYDWRLWTLPELRELLAEAGFARSTVYWEGTDDDTGEGNGDFEPRDHGEADLAWIVYIVAEK